MTIRAWTVPFVGALAVAALSAIFDMGSMAHAQNGAQAFAFNHQHVADWRSFNAPGAGPLGTYPVDINNLGEIVGNYNDATPSQQQHGFVRTWDGQITTIDPPGSTNTNPSSINNLGVVAGYYVDAQSVAHGFVRSRRGNFTTIDVPGAIGTLVFGINDLGVITGFFTDANFVAHGFVREPNGPYIAIDGPNAPPITFCFVVNARGEVGCQYQNNNNFWRGLLRHRDGSIEIFDGPGVADNSACLDSSYGYPTGTEIGEYGSLTNSGVISGHWEDANCQIHGFVRGPEGRMESFPLPPSPPYALTYNAISINEFGTVVGTTADLSENYCLGYVRFPGGALFPVVPPAPKNLGACPNRINSLGVFVGYWYDLNGTAHGFVARAIR